MSKYKVGDKVRVNVDEPEYMPYNGNVGMVEDIEPIRISVRFEDGQLCYFCPSELEVSE